MNFGTALPSSVLWVFSKWWQLSCQQMDRPNIEKQFIFLGITITRVKTFILALFVNGYLNGSKKWRHNIYKSLCTFILRVPWTVRRSNQAIWKEISPEYPLEGLMLKLKLQYFGHLMRRDDILEKTLMLGKIEGRRRRWRTEDEMVGWHHWLNGHEFEQTQGYSEKQGSLTCRSPWG